MRGVAAECYWLWLSRKRKLSELRATSSVRARALRMRGEEPSARAQSPRIRSTDRWHLEWSRTCFF